MLLATIGLSTTSCEDMFTKESDLNTTELAPEDSIYRVMGIVKQMQKLVDRTILLGEARADLVDITSATTTTLQDVAANTIGKDNSYNNVADYYAVINSCNIYIENVDTAYRVHNKQFFIKEFAVYLANARHLAKSTIWLTCMHLKGVVRMTTARYSATSLPNSTSAPSARSVRF